MAQKKDDVPKVSMTSTKKEMLEAFNELKKKLEDKSETELKPEKKKEEIRSAEVVRVADDLTPENAVIKINDLKTDIGKMLSQLSGQLEEEASNYLKIKESIELKKKELKEIYDIEASAHALAALIEAQRQKRQEFEEETAARKTLLDDEIKHKRQEWEKEKSEHQQRTIEQNAEEEKTRQRQKEEFDYDFKREQQLNKNAFRDEKEKMEKELATARETFEKNVAETEKSLNEREEKVQEREKLIDELQKQVDTFPGRIDDAVDKAIREVTDRLTSEAQKNQELLKKEYHGERNVLQTKIESLEQVVSAQEKQIEDLSGRLEKSYSKVQDIAVKAIEGSSASHRMSVIEQHLIEKKSPQSQDTKRE